MNGKRLDRSVLLFSRFTFVLFVSLFFSTAVLASDNVLTVASLVQDPLRIGASVRSMSLQLPGDTNAAQCSTSYSRTEVLSLERAVNIALCSQPKIRASWAVVGAQIASVGQATAAYLPTISFGIDPSKSHTVYPDAMIQPSSARGNSIHGSFNWRIFDFGSRYSNQQQAIHSLGASISDHDALLQTILGETIEAFFDAQSAQAAWRARQQSVDTAKLTLDSARRRESSGATAHSDTLQATTALARATLELNRSASAYYKALSVLTYVMGTQPGTPIILVEQEDIVDDEPDVVDAAKSDLGGWLDKARHSHPAIKAAEMRAVAARDQVEATRAEARPTIDLTANQYRNGYPGQALSDGRSRVSTIGISISVPITDGFLSTYRLRAYQTIVEQRDAELESAKLGVLREVEKIHSDSFFSRQNLLASRELLEAARQAYGSAQRKYDRGVTDILEILNAQNVLAEAKQERVRCLLEWQSARLRLYASAGLLGLQSFVVATH